MTPELAPAATRSVDRLKDLVWSNLPVLSLGSVLVAASWTLARLSSPQLSWMPLVLIGLLVLPAQAALVRACEVLLAGDHFGIADLPATLLGCLRSTLVVLVLPGAALLLTLAALGVWRLTGQAWMLVSVGVGAAVAAVTIFVGVVTLPYLTRTRARASEGWLASCYIASRCPIPVLAVLSAVALAVLGAAYLSFALIIVFPVPIALIWAAAVTGATRHCHKQLVSDPVVAQESGPAGQHIRRRRRVG